MPNLKNFLTMYSTPMFNDVVNQMEKIEQVFASKIQIGAIKDSALKDNISQANEQQKKLNQSMEQGEKKAGSFLFKVKKTKENLQLLSPIIKASQKAFNLSDTYAATNAHLELMAGNPEDGKALQQRIMEAAQGTRTGYLDTASWVIELGNGAKDTFGNDNEEMVKFIEQAQKSLALGGATDAKQSSTMAYLIKAMSENSLKGDALTAVMENAPGIADAIANQLGRKQTLIEYAAQGQITAEVMKAAMLSAVDEIDDSFDKLPKTWGDIWTSIQNRALGAFAPILQRINDIANSGNFSNVLDGFIGALETAAGVIAVVLGAVIGLGKAVYDNWSWIGPLILGIVIVMGTFAAILAVVNTIEAVSKGIKMASAAASLFMAAVTKKQASETALTTAAQLGLNTALLTSPLIWIVAVIIGVIAAIYLVVAAINHFMGTSISATGVVMGAFAVLGAFLMNTFFVPLMNTFSAFANLIGNLFNDPGAAIAIFFYDLAISIVGFIQTIVHAIEDLINKIPGVTVNISGRLDDLYAGLKEAQQEVKDGSKWKEYVGKPDYIDYGEAAKNGYMREGTVDDSFGNLISYEKIANFSTDGSRLLGSRYDPNTLYSGTYPEMNYSAEEIAVIAEDVNIPDENLFYMREHVANTDAGRYAASQITINQNNENYISSEVDKDEVIRAMREELIESMGSCGEGVYA